MLGVVDGQSTRPRAATRVQGVLAAALFSFACGDAGEDKSKTHDEATVVEERLPACEVGSTEACGSFITPMGEEIALGPYGAIMEPNVGEGFENRINPFDSDGGQTCLGFSQQFYGEDAMQSNLMVETPDLAFDLYTVYRPATWVEGERVPVVLWGNGTCAEPESYGALLRYVASHGFFVVAPNSRWVGTGNEILHGLDFAYVANRDPESPYFGRLDLDRVAAMGHSQGASGTQSAAKDKRVGLAILFNTGMSAIKPFLAISGEYDIKDEVPEAFPAAVESAPQGAYLYYREIPLTGSISGHLTLILQPERVVEPAAAFLKYMLREDEESGAWFVGRDCVLCDHEAEYEFGQHGL